MGFYGKVEHTDKLNFVIDRIYPNRKEMESSANEDGIFIGRYVLVDYEQEAMIKVQSEIADNSNIDLRLVTGQFTRLTITFDIEGAYLWDARIRPTLGIECLDIEEI